MEEINILDTRCPTNPKRQSLWLLKFFFFFIALYLFEICQGVHPFHINLELSKNGQTNVHGQFFLNSNAMDVDLQPLPALTYTTIGGIIDLYIFTGPTVQNVIEQYWNVIGVRV
jgi:alpha-glucosidase (family GH31 glycosyl hydrolase)